MEGATAAGGVLWPVEHDAAAVDDPGAQVAVVVDEEGVAEALRLGVELPLVGVHGGDGVTHQRLVLVDVEVGAV